MLKLKSNLGIYHYEVSLDTELFLKETAILQINTKYIWEYSILEELTNVQWLVNLKTIETENKNVANTNDTTAFAKLLNIPLQNLSLILNTNGIPYKVHNKNEILDNWKNVKDSNFLNKTLTQEIQTIVSKCDKDFSNLEQTIQNSLLYFIFFSPVYYHTSSVVKRSFTLPSVVNNGAILSNTIKQEFVEHNQEHYVFNQTCKHNDFGNLDLRKKYKNELANYLDAPFDYRFNFNAENIYNKQNGILESANATIREQASEQYVYTNNIKILLTKNINP